MHPPEAPEPTPFPLRCSCCAQLITAEQWSGLKYNGTTDEGDHFLEFRTHIAPDCGSTITIVRPLNDADARRDAEVTEQRRPKPTTPTERFRVLTEQRYRLEEGNLSSVFAVVRP